MYRPNDAVIGVMGVTGVGKSSFISLFAEDVVVGHSLEACEYLTAHQCVTDNPYRY
jgi:predicted GTPase